MVAELRATALDLHARATFAKDGERVEDTRGVIAGYLPRPVPTELQREIQTLQSASHLSTAFADGFIEVG